MSAQFKNSKRKLSQVELRRIMKEHKDKSGTRPTVNSPLAKYNEVGQLTCVLCQTIVRSEAVWPVHVNSKQHKEKVEHAKKLKEKTNNFTQPLKRPLTPPLSIPNKKLKGILKNATATSNSSSDIDSEDANIPTVANFDNGLPTDFFDVTNDPQPAHTKREAKVAMTTKVIRSEGVEKMQTDPIPEGFFDDPKQDAKARNVDYRDPIEEEWEKFQKEIRDADNESATIIAEDQLESTNERQIEEIEEQMSNWSRVLKLEQMRADIELTKPKALDNNDNAHDDDNVDSDMDDPDFFDWRSKRSFP